MASLNKLYLFASLVMLLISVLALSLVVATVNSESCNETPGVDESCDACESCNVTTGINDQIQTNGSVWEIIPPKSIHGNENVTSSIVNTWKRRPNGSFIDSHSLEEGINQQINRELFAQYTYTSMAAHFDRDDIHLPGFAKFFKEAAEEEYKHVMMLMEYQSKRGGRVKLENITKPIKDQWGNGQMAMEEALRLEKDIYCCLRTVHHKAEEAHDHQMMDFIEGKFLAGQIDTIKLLGDYVNTLGRLGPGLGEYQFDIHTLGGGERSLDQK